MSQPEEEVNRIQSYLRENARGQYESVWLPPFTLFFHPNDSLKYFNYAIPDAPTGTECAGALPGLRKAFRSRGRTPRFEFFEAFAPALPAVLRDAGFIEEGRQWSMLCTPQNFQPAPQVPGLDVTTIGPASPDTDLGDFLLAQRQGFNPDNLERIAPEEIEQARRDFQAGGWHAYLGRVDGEPAGVAVFGRPITGVTEVAGIATRLPFRRRGIASRLTWQAVRDAFALGVDTACLTAEDENAGRVYQRVGFRPFSVMLAYIDAEEKI